METLGVIKSAARHRPYMKIDVQPVSSDDDSSPCCDVIAVDNLRRQSTASNISRHSSCPDLARSTTNADQLENDVANLEDFEQTTDDLAVNKQRAPGRANKPHKLNFAARKFRQRLQSDHSIQEAAADVFEDMSPANSTPTSAHHVAVLLCLGKASINHAADVPQMTFSPTSSCDLPALSTLNNRNYQASSRCSIAGSTSDFPSANDATGDIANESGVDHSEYNDCDVSDSKRYKDSLSASVNHNLTNDRAADESNMKCQKWLQSLHISQPERIKSRSYINLRPT